MTDMTIDRLVEALTSGGNLDLAKSFANEVGDLFSDGIRTAGLGMPTTALGILGSIAIVARLRREVEEFAVNSIVEEDDPAEDADLTRAAVARIFDDLLKAPMAEVGPGPIIDVVIVL